MGFKFYTLDDTNLKGMTVGVRVDINSPIINGKVELNERIVEHSKTIKELSDKGAKVVVLAHQGRKGKDDCVSLEAHAKMISAQIGRRVGFMKEIYSSNVDVSIRSLRQGEVLVLENLRFFDDEEELDKEGNLVLKLEKLFDLFVFDAFSVAHRAQTSVVGFKKIPVVAGRVMEKELKGLNSILSTPSPHTFCFGGAKPDDLLDLLEVALPEGKVDKVLLSGVIGELALLYHGVSVGAKVNFLKEKGFLEALPRVGKLLDSFGSKFVLPVDLAVFDGTKRIEVGVSEIAERHELVEKFLVQDIGQGTIDLFAKELKGSGSVYFKGPAGNFEELGFSVGTKGLLKGLVESGAFLFMGGGHSVTAAEKFGFLEKFGYVSLAGGALVKFLAGEKLPGVEALQDSYYRFSGTKREESSGGKGVRGQNIGEIKSKVDVSVKEEIRPSSNVVGKEVKSVNRFYGDKIVVESQTSEVSKVAEGLPEEIPVVEKKLGAEFVEEDLLKPENRKDEKLIQEVSGEVKVDLAKSKATELEVMNPNKIPDELVAEVAEKKVEVDESSFGVDLNSVKREEEELKLEEDKKKEDLGKEILESLGEVEKRINEISTLSLDSEEESQVSSQSSVSSSQSPVSLKEQSFLVMGSNVIDIEVSVEDNFSHLHMGEKVVLDKDFRRSVGGAGVNVSVCLSRLSAKAFCLSKFAEETLGEVSDILTKNKVEVVKSKISKRPGAKSIVLDTLDNDRIIFTYRGQNEFLEIGDYDLSGFNFDGVYFSSLGGTSFECVLNVLKEVKARNPLCKFCYTPSIHLIKSEPRTKYLVSACDVVILNFEEAQVLVGDNSFGVSECLRKISELGAKCVVITDGSNGSYAFDGQKEYFVKSVKPKKIVDTTGAGDSYTATFFRFFVAGFDTRKCMELASKNAAANIEVKGSWDGLLYAEDLLKN